MRADAGGDAITSIIKGLISGFNQGAKFRIWEGMREQMWEGMQEGML